MIEVKNISKSYGSRLALDSVSFEVGAGEVVGLLGPNGAGKSTTMKIITGYMSPSSGEVKLGGIDVFEDPLKAKSKIGYLPEIPPVYLDMFVEDYLYYAAKLKSVPVEKLDEYVQSAITRTELGAVRKRLIGNLSKGFRQRVGLAQALVNQPDILVLDEPTVGLDPKQVAEVRDIIQALRGKHTVIISTHILSEVESICDRVVILNHGKLVASEQMSQLSRLMRASQEITLRVREPKLQESDFSKTEGILSVKQVQPTRFQIKTNSDEAVMDLVAALVLEKKAGLVELSAAENQLEKVFLNLTYGAEAHITSDKQTNKVEGVS